MKVRYYYYWLENRPSNDLYYLCRSVGLLGADAETTRMYNSYVFSALSTDFPINHPEFVESVIKAISRIEQDEIDAYTWEGDGFTHDITRNIVTFEHAIFNECPEWPIWSCPLSHYKVALLGWRRFIDMPRAIGTELIIELPN